MLRKQWISFLLQIPFQIQQSPQMKKFRNSHFESLSHEYSWRERGVGKVVEFVPVLSAKYKLKTQISFGRVCAPAGLSQSDPKAVRTAMKELGHMTQKENVDQSIFEPGNLNAVLLCAVSRAIQNVFSPSPFTND
jgi:hypothetical protein